MGLSLPVEKLVGVETESGVALVFLTKAGRSVSIHLEDAQADELARMLDRRERARPKRGGKT